MATAPAPPPPAAAAPAQQVDLSKLCEAYRNIRDAKAVRQKQWEEEEAAFDAKLEMIEGFLLRHFNQNNIDSVKTAGGTAYRQERIKPNIVDDVAFYDWIKTNDAFDALERRVKVTTIKAFMEEHKGGLPPGIAVSREWEVRVRKPQ